MRRHNLLRLAGACALGLVASLSYASSASAFAGLSAKQQAHIETYIHCKTLLLTDFKAFAADPLCGGTPNFDRRSMGTEIGGATPPPEKEPCGGGEQPSLLFAFQQEQECPTE